ncbi:MAG: FxLYD domain-containing protein [Patescibacteria group bacterium]
MSISRVQKQAIVGLLYVIIVGAVTIGVYDLATPDATCTDGIQNQKEEGIDCGTVCGVLCDPAPVAPQVKSTQLLAVGSGDYDVVSEIVNPNNIYGSSKIGYVITLTDQDGKLIASEPGVFYIAPAQTKFLVRSSIKAEPGAVSASIAITEAVWEKVTPDGLLVNFPLRRESFTESRTPGAASQFEGVVFNDSDFDFNTVDVVVVVLDANEKVLGVNTTELRTVASRTERYFKVVWPTLLPGMPAKTRIQAGADLFSNENFIRRYGTQEKFQQYYEGR